MREIAGELDHEGVKLAWKRVEGEGPTIVWLGGFRSDMTGSKAQTLAEWAERTGRSYIRFDYLGHGASGGTFQDGTISRWRADALAVIDQLTQGPLVLVGSSMGGWIACLAALSRPERLAAMVLLAPAPDFIDKLIRPSLTPEILQAINRDGVWIEPSPYGEHILTRDLLEDGARWNILDGPIGINVPVRILQGAEDRDVPWRHALALSEALESRDVVFTLIKNGNHRLSREKDLERLVRTVEEVL